ncbi:F-box/kelch-repeat protein At3g06240-like [Malus domestica]|uniref:F-box/kelch-repeat protein At3g06240-like n=1 Tax=Malus domestica TaxID=3750 RepID=UPI000498786C|nr:F-box/kelch-repeat protein At3g06240-like [Malus domestica]
MTYFCNIPDEIGLEILARLPPKSLMRFKCVRKSWYVLFNNPHFVAEHLRLYNDQPSSSSTCILFKRSVLSTTEFNNEELVFSFLSLRNDKDSDVYHNPNCTVEDLHFPHSMGLKSRGQFIELPGQELGESVSIVGHCDGIFCLYLYTGKLVLYNPAIKEFRVLPESCFEDAFSCTLGFGYDPKRKDYILISIVSYGEEILEDDRLIIHPPQAEIYTLSTNSWKKIGTDYLETENTYFWGNDNFSTYFEGVFYGLGYEEKKEFLPFYGRLEEEKRQLVISYDAINEVFHDILLPDCFYEFPTHEFSLTVWNESVALFGFYHGEDEEPFEIWLMDEFDDGWTKHLSVVRKLDQEVDIPLILWKRDEVLLVDIDGRLASYNFNTENLMYLPVHGVSRGDFQAVVCVDSIVSVNGDKRLEIKDSFVR